MDENDVSYDHYVDYAELTAQLVYFNEHYLNYTRLTSLEKTPEGRHAVGHTDRQWYFVGSAGV